MFLLYILLSLTLKVNVVYAYRILCVYPTEMYSHQSVLRVLTEELARHGNEVVVITPLPAGTSVDNITEIDVYDVSSQIWVEGGFDKMLKQTNGISIDAVQTMQFINQVELKLLDAQFNAPVVQQIIEDKKQKFDLIFVEACVPLSIMFAARFDAPVIEVSSFFGSHENLLTIGAPIHPFIFPSYNQRKTRNLSFWDKLSVMYTFLRLRYIEYYANVERNKVIRKYFGAGAPSIAQLRTRIEMLFLNVHPTWADNLPAPPALLYLGALHLKEAQPLPEVTLFYSYHQSVLRVLTEELARHGNELVVVTPLPVGTAVANITEIDVHDASMKIWEEQGLTKAMKQRDTFSLDAEQTMLIINKLELKLLEAHYHAPAVQELIQDETQKFDVIFVEGCAPLSIMFAARFDAPVIEVSSFFGSHENLLTIGAPIHPLIFPSYNQRKTRNLSFWDKLSVMYTFLRLRYIEYYANVERNKVIRKYFGAAAPSVAELRTRIEMLFLNVHPAWADNLPAPPALLYLGALHLKEPLPLPEDLQTYLDSSRKGVIYVSLGSTLNISDLPHHITAALFNVFKSLPYDILLKAKHENVGFKLENLRIEKWLPQNDLLHHPKIKLFITHGGLQSIDEAIAANVPMVVMPITGDAWYNAQKCEQFGIGKEIDLNTLNENDLRNAILDIAGNETYRRNIASLSLVLQEQRAGGLQRAVRGAARVAARAARPLRSPLADASLVQLLMLDVLAAAAAVAAVTIVAAGALTVALYRAVRRALAPRRKRKTN